MNEKAFTYGDLISDVTTDPGVAYVNYWAEPSKELVQDYKNKYNIKTDGCASECKVCQITHIEKYKNLSQEPWKVKCNFIPDDYEKLIPQKFRDEYDDESLELLKSAYDPVTFGIKMFGWKARKHQEIMLRCTAKRKVLRWGRRSGKSEGFALEVLWFVNTNTKKIYNHGTGEYEEEGVSVVIVAPYLTQIENIFEMLQSFISKNDEIKASMAKPMRKTPSYYMEFKNGATIKGFTTGSKSSGEATSIRGVDADYLLLDEADFMTEGDHKSIMPIMQSNPNVVLRASSTPKGKREKFYQWCTEQPGTKEFYFPTPVLERTPLEEIGLRWHDLREDMRPDFSHDEWLQEIMAIFVAQTEGVYQPKFITDAQKDYYYSDMEAMLLEGKLSHWTFGIGVDWNSNAGTEICVLGWETTTGGRVMETVNIPKQEWTQFKAMEEIFNLWRKWRPEFLYVDEGYGSTQIEYMKLAAQEAAPDDPISELTDKLYSYQFGGKIEIRDPSTDTIVKKPAKSFMVENSVRKFENRRISYSVHDEVLTKQLYNYIITGFTQSNVPIYGVNNKKTGDHRLDALNLALVGFALKKSVVSPDIGGAPSVVRNVLSSAHKLINEIAGKARPQHQSVGSMAGERRSNILKRNDNILNDNVANLKIGWENDTEEEQLTIAKANKQSSAGVRRISRRNTRSRRTLW